MDTPMLRGPAFLFTSMQSRVEHGVGERIGETVMTDKRCPLCLIADSGMVSRE